MCGLIALYFVKFMYYLLLLLVQCVCVQVLKFFSKVWDFKTLFFRL